MTNVKTKKKVEKKVETEELKVGRIIVSGHSKPSEKDIKEIVDSLCDVEPYERVCNKDAKRSKKRYVNMPEENLPQKLIYLANKNGYRGSVCKILISKCEISRTEFKKFNKWGDNRFLAVFTDETYRNGDVYYVLKESISKNLKACVKG